MTHHFLILSILTLLCAAGVYAVIREIHGACIVARQMFADDMAGQPEQVKS